MNSLTIWKYETNGKIQTAGIHGKRISGIWPYPMAGGTMFMSNWTKHIECVRSLMDDSYVLCWENTVGGITPKRQSQEGNNRVIKLARRSLDGNIERSELKERLCFKCHEPGHVQKYCTM